MSDTFRTIKAASTGMYKEKGSKFLSFAYPVENEAGVQHILDQLKKTYHDARHHCYAYILGKEMDIFRTNDDGEPHHSAGDPILGQLRSHELTDTLIVVVRYFGGTKLGVGGLVQAYKTAAAAAIASGEIITKILMTELTISFAYEAMDQVMGTISRNDLKITHQAFGSSCLIKLECRANIQEEVKTLLAAIPSLNAIT